MGCGASVEHRAADGSVAKLVVSSPSGKGLVPRFHGRHSGPDHTGRVGRTWILWSLELGSASGAAELVVEGPPENCRLRWKEQNLCLEVDCRKMEEGRNIWLWNDDPPVPAGSHSTFALNDDGSISPSRQCPGSNGGNPSRFALGLRGSRCVLVGRDDTSRLIFGWAGGGGSGKPGNDAPGRFSFANLLGWAGGGSGKSGGGAVLGNDLSGRWFSFARADGRPNGDRYEFRRAGDVYKIYRNGHHNHNDQFTLHGATGFHAHGPTFTLQANGDLHWDLDGGKWGSRKEGGGGLRVQSAPASAMDSVKGMPGRGASSKVAPAPEQTQQPQIQATIQPEETQPQRTVLVPVPPGCGPGMPLQVQTPTGQIVQIVVPAGAGPGSQFQVAY